MVRSPVQVVRREAARFPGVHSGLRRCLSGGARSMLTAEAPTYMAAGQYVATERPGRRRRPPVPSPGHDVYGAEDGSSG
jgi:hypothetical protein